MRRLTGTIPALALIAASGCAGEYDHTSPAPPPRSQQVDWSTSQTTPSTKPGAAPNRTIARPVAAVKPGDDEPEPATLEHITHLSPTLISGSEPVTDADFALIRAMGAKTIISVDGATPDVERARRYGLRYVHIPIAYSALNASEEVQLERAAREVEGPIFVHCHHGLHRGPVAAAVIHAAETGCSGAEAARLLYEAGLPRKYKALHDSLEAFVPGTRTLPDPSVVGALPEIAQRDSLTLAMADIDRSWERLRACRESGWSTPTDQPDVEPAHEAAIFAELYRETNRLHLAGADPDMRARMIDAERLAWALNRALESADAAGAETVADAIAQSCTDCHNIHRNN